MKKHIQKKHSTVFQIGLKSICFLLGPLKRDSVCFFIDLHFSKFSSRRSLRTRSASAEWLHFGQALVQQHLTQIGKFQMRI